MNLCQFVQEYNMCDLDKYIVDVRNHQILQFLHDYLVLQSECKVLNQVLEVNTLHLHRRHQPLLQLNHQVLLDNLDSKLNHQLLHLHL